MEGDLVHSNEEQKRKKRPEEQNCWSDREGIRTARGTAKRNGRKRREGRQTKIRETQKRTEFAISSFHIGRAPR